MTRLRTDQVEFAVAIEVEGVEGGVVEGVRHAERLEPERRAGPMSMPFDSTVTELPNSLRGQHVDLAVAH